MYRIYKISHGQKDTSVTWETVCAEMEAEKNDILKASNSFILALLFTQSTIFTSFSAIITWTHCTFPASYIQHQYNRLVPDSNLTNTAVKMV